MSSRRIKFVAAFILALGLAVWFCDVKISEELGDEGWGGWRYGVGLIIYRAELGIQARILGRTHEDTLGTQRGLVISLLNHEKYAKAEKECRAALATRGQIAGPEQSQMLELQHNLITALEGQGKTAEAEQEIRKRIAGEEHVFGAEDPLPLAHRRYLAYFLSARGKFAEAEEEYRAVLPIEERVFGPEDSNVCSDYLFFAMCLEAQGKLKEALSFVQRAEAGLKGTRGGVYSQYEKAREARERIEGKLKESEAGKGGNQ